MYLRLYTPAPSTERHSHMLHVIDKPRQIAENQGEVTKKAYLFGSLKAISDIAKMRLQDRLCHQIPRDAFSKPYHVRVDYVVAVDGEVSVDAVWVAFKPSRWTCFYEELAGKYGKCEAENKTSRSYYLEDGEDLRKVLYDYEQRIALKRLTKKGPEIFATARAH